MQSDDFGSRTKTSASAGKGNYLRRKRFIVPESTEPFASLGVETTIISVEQLIQENVIKDAAEKLHKIKNVHERLSVMAELRRLRKRVRDSQAKVRDLLRNIQYSLPLISNELQL